MATKVKNIFEYKQDMKSKSTKGYSIINLDNPRSLLKVTKDYPKLF